MKILLSALQYPTKSYPFAIFISMIAEEFVRAGHEVTVIAPQSITRSLIRKTALLPEYEKIEVDGASNAIKVYRPKSLTFGEGKIRGKLTIKSNRLSAMHCLKELSEDFDIVYAHFWESVFNVVDFCKANNLPLVAVSGEDKISIQNYISQSDKNRLRSVVSKVIGVSSKNIRESIDAKLADPSKCLVIPNGPDLNTFFKVDRVQARQKLNISEDIFVVAFIGRFIHRKGALRVEEAIQKLGDENIKAVFIGSVMNDEDKNQEPSGEEILFKGVLPHDDIPMWLCASDIYVLPTLAEGCSNSIVEAMACGLPIVSSDRDFNYDVLDESNAILIDPLDVDHIAIAIDRLRKSSDLREKMGLASLKKAEDISFEKRVDKILTILNNLVNHENSRI